MKKALALSLALCLLFGMGMPAGAAGWSQQSAGRDPGAPFAVEVYTLQAHTDVTGAAYYTLFEEGATYPFHAVYYAVKLTLPAAAEANAYAGRTDMYVGYEVTVELTYTNLTGKKKTSLNVPLTGYKQTLWFNGSAFVAQGMEQAARKNGCPCPDAYILNAEPAEPTEAASIMACIHAGTTDVLLGGVYKVTEKTFRGARPCERCAPADMAGFALENTCGVHGVFFAVDANGKVTQVYAYDLGNCAATDLYAGGFVPWPITLYAWAPTDAYTPCNTCAARMRYSLEEISGVTFRADGSFANPAPSDGYFGAFLSDFAIKPALRDWNRVYYKNGNDFVPLDLATAMGYGPLYRKGRSPLTGAADSNGYFPYNVPTAAEPYLNAGNIYYWVGAYTDTQLYPMLTETLVACDTSEKAYLHTIDHVFRLMEISYADILAGKIYLSALAFAANYGGYFGYAACDDATWNASAAAITATPTAAVPATGGVEYAALGLLPALVGLLLLYRFPRRKRGA